MGTRHWPEDADDEVERLEGIITTLRQRVAELEGLIDLDVFSLAESNDLLRQRVAELEKERVDCGKLGLDLCEQFKQLIAERDAMKKLYESSEESVLSLKETRNRLAEERDKATQYWQIAEGRCDALIKQKDELLAALEELSLYIAYNGDDWVQKKARAAIASVKEKQNAANR